MREDEVIVVRDNTHTTVGVPTTTIAISTKKSLDEIMLGVDEEDQTNLEEANGCES